MDSIGKPPTDGRDERQFLHDIASPIATAMFLVDSILDSMQSRQGADPDELQQMTQVSNAMEIIKKKLVDRRKVLIERGVPSERA